MKRSTNKPSTAAGSCVILAYFVGLSRDSSRQFGVDLPAAGAQSERQPSSLPARTDIAGSVSQLVMVVEVFISERDAEHALPDQRSHRVLDISPVARAAKAAGQATNQTDRLVGRSQQ